MNCCHEAISLTQCHVCDIKTVTFSSLKIFFLQKLHTPFDGTKQQGSDETYGMAGVGEKQGQLDRP